MQDIKNGSLKRYPMESRSLPVSLIISAVIRDRPKFGFGYGVSAETTKKYGFGLVSVKA